jgi:AAA domain
MSDLSRREIRDVLAEQVAPRDPVWLVEQPPIPLHGVTVVAGFRAATKTTFACWLAAQATAKGDVVFMCSQEDDLSSFIRPRVEAAGADLSRVRFPDEQTVHLRLPHDIIALGNYVKRNRVRLAIFDPLEAIVSGFMSADRVRDSLTRLTSLAQVLDCGMVCIHHFRKSGAKDVFAAIGGSGAITNAARAVYAYGAKAADPFEHLLGRLSGHGGTEDGDHQLEEGDELRVLAHVKLSGGPPPESLAFRLHVVPVPGLLRPVPRLTLLGETAVSANMILAAGTTGPHDPTQQTMVEEATQWLLGYLVEAAPNGEGHKERSTTDVLTAGGAEGFSQRTLERTRAEMKRRGLVNTVRHDDAWWIRLNVPDVGPPESL